MCQIPSLMAATEGPAAQFSSFVNFEERKRKSNLLMSFPKIVHQKGSFGQIRKNPLFRFCRPILDIFRLTLLRCSLYGKQGKKTIRLMWLGCKSWHFDCERRWAEVKSANVCLFPFLSFPSHHINIFVFQFPTFSYQNVSGRWRNLDSSH